MNNYTLEDIRKFIDNMERNYLIRMQHSIKNIPFVGGELYQKALFEQLKVDILRRELERVEVSTIEVQEKYIRDFTPILLRTESKKRIRTK